MFKKVLDLCIIILRSYSVACVSLINMQLLAVLSGIALHPAAVIASGTRVAGWENGPGTRCTLFHCVYCFIFFITSIFLNPLFSILPPVVSLGIRKQSGIQLVTILEIMQQVNMYNIYNSSGCRWLVGDPRGEPRCPGLPSARTPSQKTPPSGSCSRLRETPEPRVTRSEV